MIEEISREITELQMLIAYLERSHATLEQEVRDHLTTQRALVELMKERFNRSHSTLYRMRADLDPGYPTRFASQTLDITSLITNRASAIGEFVVSTFSISHLLYSFPPAGRNSWLRDGLGALRWPGCARWAIRRVICSSVIIIAHVFYLVLVNEPQLSILVKQLERPNRL